MAALDRVGTPQQVALMAGAAVTPGTFARSLSERSWADQGLVTGLTVGSTYLATVLAQDAMDIVGQLGRRPASRCRRAPAASSGTCSGRWP